MGQGINENIRYKGRVFHVQTEERGKEIAVLVCTLFYGGMILCEERLAYQDIINSDRFHEQVDQLSKNIHRQMIENLMKGLYDEKIDALPMSEGASEEATSLTATADEDALEYLFRSYLLPSLSRDLKVDLPEHEALAISEKIPFLKGSSKKERYLSLCAEIYARVRDRCDKEAFKSLVKKWSTGIRFHADVPRDRFP
ncbi:MAG: hypothetical protein IEMM0007_1378 [bacterium]|nr:MAG: hypothetical protein IEMM0007_1378 [bacterium]